MQPNCNNIAAARVLETLPRHPDFPLRPITGADIVDALRQGKGCPGGDAWMAVMVANQFEATIAKKYVSAAKRVRAHVKTNMCG